MVRTMLWRPAHETHAIERVNLTLVFADPVPGKAWKPMIEDVSRRFLAAGYTAQTVPAPVPGSVQIQIMPMMLGSSPSADDRTFVLTNNGLAQEEILIARQHIVFSLNKYSSWRTFSDRIQELLSVFIEEFLSLSRMSMSRLEYWDRFTHSHDEVFSGYGGLFKNESQYIPSFAYHIGGLFHVHNGFFIRENSVKRLINMNVDAVDVPAFGAELGKTCRSVGVYTLAQDTVDAQSTAYDKFDGALSQLDEMHTTLKELLAEVIVQEMQNRISLFPSRA